MINYSTGCTPRVYSGCGGTVVHTNQALESFISGIRSTIPSDFGVGDAWGRSNLSSNKIKYVRGSNGSNFLDRENNIFKNLDLAFQDLNTKINQELTALATLKDNYRNVDKYLNDLVLELGLDPIPGKMDTVTIVNTNILDFTQNSDRYIDISEGIISISGLDPSTRDTLFGFGLIDNSGNSEFLSSLELPYDRRTNSYAIPNMVFKEENGKYSLVIQLDVTDHNGNTVTLDDKIVADNVKNAITNIYMQQGSETASFLGEGVGYVLGRFNNLFPTVVGTDTKYLCLDLTSVVEKAIENGISIDELFGGD